MQNQPDPRTFAALPDADLLEAVQRQTFRFFWEGGHPVSGLALDRSYLRAEPENELVTVGGSAFGILAFIVAVERGWQSRAEVLERLLDRPPVAHPIIDEPDHGEVGARPTYNTPFVEGTPVSVGSIATAARSARAKALKDASIMWWALPAAWISM